MKTILLAGGFGTSISEESHLKPKPMIEIGEYPILWHIMKIYSAYGFNDFVVCLGYKACIIKEYFANYFLHASDVTYHLASNKMELHCSTAEPWQVTLVNTGLSTMTGGRVKRIQSYIKNDTFMLTYGDGVSDIDIRKLVKFHKAHGKIATITAVKPEGRFGVMDIYGNQIGAFREKNNSDTGWINAGFMVLSSSFFQYLEGDETILEKEPLERIASEGQLMAYKHNGFWQCMDTQRDKLHLEELWFQNRAPWKIW